MSKILEFPTKDQDQRAAQIVAVRRMLLYPKGAEEHEGGFDKPPLNLPENVETVLRNDPHYRCGLFYDAFQDQVVWDDEAIRDEDLTRIRIELARTYRLRVSMQTVSDIVRYVTRECLPHRHPVREYLKRLIWDGVPRLDSWLSRYAGVADSDIAQAIGRRFAIGAVARILRPGSKLDTVLILQGPQGIGKSTLFRVLGGEWFRDDALDLRGKDAVISIKGTWLHELAELASTRSRDNETVKAFLSKTVDRYRPPYGRCEVTQPRSVCFVGTTNEASFLTDVESRRFWPVTVSHRIDLEALRRDRDQLWAEAVVAFNADEPWWLSHEESEWLRESQEQFKHEDPWLTPVRNFLHPRHECTIDEVLTQAIDKPAREQRRGDEMRLGTVLTTLGWVKRRVVREGRRRTVWFRD